MRIAVDARLLDGGGIGRFIREVTGRWPGRDDVERVCFLGDPERLERWVAELPGADRAEVARWRDPAYSIRAQLRGVPLRVGPFRRADVSFFPHYDVPVLGQRTPSVVVVHDLTQFQPGAPFPLHKRVLGGLLLSTVLRRATRIVTVSENSRNDLATRVPSIEPRLRIVPPGVTKAFRPLNGERRTAFRWDSFRPFLLTVGEPRPHKRIEFAVELLAELRRNGHGDLKLLAVGAAGGPACPVRRRAVEEGVSDQVVAMGRVTDDTLRELYGMAEALVFPSLYEGFGLPVAEAVACGCPVLASDRASIPEAANGEGVLLDTFDIDAWRNAYEERPARNGAHGPDLSASWDRASDAVFGVVCEAVRTEGEAVA